MNATDPAKSISSVVSPGDTVDRYIVEEVLGAGGMGVVVAARHAALGHRVAMKFIGLWASADADSSVRFTREAQIIATVQSDHVVRVTDFGTHNGSPYMVMDLLSGRDLRRELEMRGPLPVHEALDYVIEACDGLSAVHEKGVVHRDVKLANLFLETRADGERSIKVVDFGVSKLRSNDEDVSLTQTATLIGSPLYMSPEQTRDARVVDARADIWSLGVVLQKLLTGGAPFQGQSSSAISAAIAADAPIPLRATAPHLPAELEAVVLRCLEKKPALRYASVALLAADLAPFASSRGKLVAERLAARAPVADMPSLEPASAFPQGGNTTIVEVDLEETAAASVVDDVARAPRSRRVLLWGGVLITAVAAAVIVAFEVRHPPISVAPAADTTVVAAAIDSATVLPTASVVASPIASESTPIQSAAPTAPSTVEKARDEKSPRRHHARPPSTPPVHAASAPVAATSASEHFGGSALDDHL